MAFFDYWRGDRSRNRDEWRGSQREWESPQGRERTPRDEGFQRRGRRDGSDYYGNDPGRYGSGNYDQFAERNYANERRAFEGGDDWRRDQHDFGDDDRSRGRSFHDRWQNAYSAPNPRAYVGYSGYGGGDYGEHDESFGGSLFTGQGDDRIHAFDDLGHRGRGPKGYRRSDERIREDVCECLTDDDRVDASNIEVTVKDCEMTLSGSVSSRDQKRRAESIIDALPGVKDVHNRLRVAEENQAQQSQAQQSQAEATKGSAQSSQRDPLGSGSRH